MGFMDKVKAQADQLAQKAQEGAKAGQDKLSGLQAKRHTDSAAARAWRDRLLPARQAAPGRRATIA